MNDEFDLILDHEMAKKIVNATGWDGFLLFIEQEFHYNLYSCSQYWIQNSRCIAKLKGEKGDVIIGWKGVHG